MQKFSNRSLSILLVVFLGAAVLVALGITKVKTDAFIAVGQDVVFEQEVRLKNLAKDLTNTSKPLPDVALKDCETDDRYQFDALLGQLSTLSRSQLEELNNLFAACGDYFATIQMLRTAQLAREIEVYKDELRSLATVDKHFEEKLSVIPDWFNLQQKAQEQSLLLNELVKIQSEIIDLLLASNSTGSEVVQERVARGQEIRENIVFLDQQLRETMSSLINS